MSDLFKVVRNTYSEKHLAINNALLYANQERETIYVWKSLIGAQQHEYTLRKRADIIDVHSDHIVHTVRYDGTLQPTVKFKTHNGLRKLVRVDP